MLIQKQIKSTIDTDYIFIEGKSKIDCKYFIDKINNNSQKSTTHVVGDMTNFKFFVNDLNFENFIVPVLSVLDNYTFLRKYNLMEAWGLKEGYGQRTTKHDHLPNYLSGVLYLNNHKQKLLFDEIKQEVKPEEGKFVLFSSFLKHKAERNLSREIKYAIAFNFAFDDVYNNSP